MNALRCGQMTAAQVATDAFGNALARSISEGMRSTQGVGAYSALDYRNGSDIESDNYAPPATSAPVAGPGNIVTTELPPLEPEAPISFAEDTARRKAALNAENNPMGLPMVVARSDDIKGMDLQSDQYQGGRRTASKRADALAQGVSMGAPSLTAADLKQQAQTLSKQATQLADAADWARKNNMPEAAYAYQQAAAKAYYDGQKASLTALDMNSKSLASIAPSVQGNQYGANWSYMGQNSVGYAQGRGILPDYQSINLSSHTLTGTVSTNFYDGTTAYGGGVQATNVDPGFLPSPSVSFGWIFGVNDAKGVTDFTTGSGTQFGVAIPTPWKLSPSIVINHSYGGAWALELGVVPRTPNTVFVYQPYGYAKELEK